MVQLSLQLGSLPMWLVVVWVDHCRREGLQWVYWEGEMRSSDVTPNHRVGPIRPLRGMNQSSQIVRVYGQV